MMVVTGLAAILLAIAALLVIVSGVPAYWATVQLQKRRRRA